MIRPSQTFASVFALDSGFSSDGTVIGQNIAGGTEATDYGTDLIENADGTYMVTGYSQSNTSPDSELILLKYTSSGELDTSWGGGDGIITNDGGGVGSEYGRAIQAIAGGKYLIAGDSLGRATIWQFNSDGSPDTGFGDTGDGFSAYWPNLTGSETITIYDFAVDASNKIILVGDYDDGTDNYLTVWRFNSDGSLDTTFNSTGYLNILSSAGGSMDRGRSIEIAADGDYLISGYSRDNSGDNYMTLWKLQADATLDVSFGNTSYPCVNGAGSDPTMGCILAKVSIESVDREAKGYDLKIDSSNKIVVTGFGTDPGNYEKAVVWRFNSDGSTDTTFNTVGYVVHDPPTDVGYYYTQGEKLLISGGKIYVYGFFLHTDNNNYPIIYSFNNDGSVNTSFTSTGYKYHLSPGTLDYSYAGGFLIDSENRFLFTDNFYNSLSNYDLILGRLSFQYQIEQPSPNVDFKVDSTSVKLGSSNGVSGGTENVTVEYYGLPLIDIDNDFSSDRDWSSVSFDVDYDNQKSLAHGATTADGAGGSFSLYVPVGTGTAGVRICPNATTIDEVTSSCTDGYNLTASELVTIESKSFTHFEIPVYEQFSSDPVPPTDSGDAVWTTGGDVNWERNSSSNMAQNGVITDEQYSWLTLTYTFPAEGGKVAFDWQVSSEQDCDYLYFCVDDTDCFSPYASISGETSLANVQASVTSGIHTFTWYYYKDGSVAVGDDRGSVDNIKVTEYLTPLSSLTIDQSFTDIGFPPTNSGATWTTGGDLDWQRNTGTYSSDPASAGSQESLGDSQTSWLDLNYTFPDTGGTISFDWKVSSEENYDYLIFCVDNDTCTVGGSGPEGDTTNISGEIDWTNYSAHVSSGSHSFRWLYGKDSGSESGSDSGWIDNVHISAEQRVESADFWKVENLTGTGGLALADLSTPTPTPTSDTTPTPTPTTGDTPTPTPTSEDTPTPTPTMEDTPTPTPTSENTPTPTPTSENSPTPTPTASNTPTSTPTPTASNTPTSTPTGLATATPTPTTVPPGASATPTPTITQVASVTPTFTKTPTPTPDDDEEEDDDDDNDDDNDEPTHTPAPTATPTIRLVYLASTLPTTTPTALPTPTSKLTATVAPKPEPSITESPSVNEEKLAEIKEFLASAEAITSVEAPPFVVDVAGTTKNVDLESNLHVFADESVDFKIPATSFEKDNTLIHEVTLLINDQAYIMELSADKSYYQVRFRAPQVLGAFTTSVIATYADKTASSMKMNILVDPFGYIYYLQKGQELRINNATITLYTKQNNQVVLWTNASSTSSNPQSSNQQGEYAFLVEAGEYQLQVTAPGYDDYTSEWFPVVEEAINKNIKLKQKVNYWYIYLIATLVTIFIMIIIFKRRKDRKEKN